MPESAALDGWRRRAGEAHERRWRPSRTAVGSVAAVTVLSACVLLGGRAVNGEDTRAPLAAAKPLSAPQPATCPVIATGLRSDVAGDRCGAAVSFADAVLSAGRVRIQ